MIIRITIKLAAFIAADDVNSIKKICIHIYIESATQIMPLRYSKLCVVRNEICRTQIMKKKCSQVVFFK